MTVPITTKHIYVAVALVVNANNQVLMVRRKEEEVLEAHDKWELPGGKPEGGETIENASERETFEETGYRILAQSLLPHPFYATWQYADHVQHTTILCVKCVLRDDVAHEVPSPDHHVSEIQWVDMDALPTLPQLPGVSFFVKQLLSLK